MQEACKVPSGTSEVSYSSFDKVELSVNDDCIESSINFVRFKITVNNINGLLLTGALEEFNYLVGKDNLFVRSLTLVKLWINLEAKRFTYLGICLFYVNNYFHKLAPFQIRSLRTL